MELGNLVFGNSGGEFPIDRNMGYEDHLDRLFHNIEIFEGYIDIFENDTFSIFPYYWGDCTCGYRNLESIWNENNSHSNDCYQQDYKKAYKPFVKINKDWLSDHKNFYNKKLRPIYEKYGWDTESKYWWYGCAIKCTCDYNSKWKDFIKSNNHISKCLLIVPNFLYKPTDFYINWYKYPLRDSYMNVNLSVKEFSNIIDKCIKSLD